MKGEQELDRRGFVAATTTLLSGGVAALKTPDIFIRALFI
jgi:hypothetical protein